MMLSNRGSAGAGGSGVTQNEHSDQITNTQKASFIRTPPDCLSPPILCKHMATLFYRSPDVNQDKAISPRQWEEGRNSLLSELGTCTHWDLWGKKKIEEEEGDRFMQDAADLDSEIWTCKGHNQILNPHCFLALYQWRSSSEHKDTAAWTVAEGLETWKKYTTWFKSWLWRVCTGLHKIRYLAHIILWTDKSEINPVVWR